MPDPTDTPTDPVSLRGLLVDADDPADTLAGLIFSGAWFPPDPRAAEDGVSHD